MNPREVDNGTMNGGGAGKSKVGSGHMEGETAPPTLALFDRERTLQVPVKI